METLLHLMPLEQVNIVAEIETFNIKVPCGVIVGSGVDDCTWNVDEVTCEDCISTDLYNKIFDEIIMRETFTYNIDHVRKSIEGLEKVYSNLLKARVDYNTVLRHYEWDDMDK